MRRHSLSQEVIAVLASLLFLALGLLIVWITKAVLNTTQDAVFISLLLVPVLVYMILSGRLQELSGPGGLAAKFANVADKPVEVAFETIDGSVQPEESEILEKANLSELEKTLPRIDESRPLVLTMRLGLNGYYQRYALLQYVKALSQYRNFRFVVILDKDGRFVAYLPIWTIRQILEMPVLGDEFIQEINAGRDKNLARYPGVAIKTISTKATNVEALREMTTQSLEALVVIDEDRKLRGVVEREQVLSKLMLAIAK